MTFRGVCAVSGLLGAGAMGWAQAAVPEWTVLLYMDADNNLEPAMMIDLMEAAQVGSSESVKIFALIDRTKGYSSDRLLNLPDFSTAKFVEVQKGRLRQIADWGEVDMADPKTLERFVDEGLAQAKGKRVKLVMSNHGGGWLPGWVDEDNGGEDMSQQEMAGALTGLARRHGRFEVLTFDACLMGNLETAYALRDTAKYLIASEELVPGLGFDYAAGLGALAANPKMSTVEFGTQFCNAAYDFYAQAPVQWLRDQELLFTISLVDLGKIEGARDALMGLAKELNTLRTQRPELMYRMHRAQRFTTTFGVMESDDSLSLKDAWEMAEFIKRGNGSPGAVTAANRFQQSVRSAVLHSQRGPGVRQGNGLTVFWPHQRLYLGQVQTAVNYGALAFHAGARTWVDFLEAYTKALATDVTPPKVTVTAPKEGENTIQFTWPQREIAQAQVFVGVEGSEKEVGWTILLGEMPYLDVDAGKASLEVVPAWPVITDGKQVRLAPIAATWTKDGQAFFDISALIQVPGEDEWQLGVLTMAGAENGAEGRLVRVAVQVDSTFRVLSDLTGVQARTIYRMVNFETGDYQIYEPPAAAPFAVEALSLKIANLNPGAYRFGMVFEDWSGNVAGGFVPATLSDD